VLLEHKGGVKFASFSPDWSMVLTGSADLTFRLRDANTGQFLNELKGHTTAPTPRSFSPDGTRMITSNFDSTLRVWDV
jgi:WD40 repeat protein